MVVFLNPDGVPRPNPASYYSQVAIHGLGGGGRRLVMSGQVGLKPDGSVAADLEGQMDVAWDNLIAAIRGAGMDIANIVKVTIYITVTGAMAKAREVRLRKLAGHSPPFTYVEVAALALPDFLFEIEAEAVEEPKAVIS